ncbi:TetR family transcriptional regulator [Murinocardiopsis flavida]|uniref:TetR family transcriptional regulator n=1 Tax=Murinocardiopsis flavida TaxID=645275 RepID=A0A2P8DFB7_9ACTN|nr:TetR family transcriptional regulator [Murinocardiopsis flavida]PSK95900.1 TetR family transcriptional regulator [Murinocardiopsis flavida]
MSTGSPRTGEPSLPLRERKKLRTRRALIGTALELFTERGFDHVTLDELVDRVEVSKRTFFRTFASKEDAALAPEQEFWAACVHDIADRPMTGPLLGVLHAALVDGLDAMDDGWAARFRSSRRLADATPALMAHSLAFCARTTAELAGLLAERLGLDPTDSRPRLVLGVMLAAWHLALDEWSADGGPGTRETLAEHVAAALADVPRALALTAP